MLHLKERILKSLSSHSFCISQSNLIELQNVSAKCASCFRLRIPLGGPLPVDQIEDQEEAGEDTEKRHVSPGESLTAGS